MLSLQRLIIAVCAIFCLVLFLQLYNRSEQPPPGHAISYRTKPNPSIPEHHSSTDKSPPSDGTFDACAGLNGLEDIVIVLKTGASEIYSKLPIHFATTFACKPDFLIYSDLEQDFGPVKVHDALSMTSEELKRDPGFEYYRTLAEHVCSGGDAAKFKGQKSWEVDRFKFLPMISDAYERYGDDKKWYVFIEADTYLSMYNLMLWLAELDPTASIYGGAQILIGGTEFAHGGSGFLLSAPAAKALTEVYKNDTLGWETKLGGECCGDKITADVLMAADPPVGVLRSFPTIQGETPSSLDWSTVHWCMPAVSWHHVDAPTMDKLWNFERQWKAEKGTAERILFRDYYAAFVEPRLIASDWRMHAWDNLSKDWTYTPNDHPAEFPDAHTSPEACERTCREIESCLQWAWRPDSCRGDKVVRLGWALDSRPELGSADDRVVKAQGEGDEKAVAGWMGAKIREYKKQFDPCGNRSYWITRNKEP